MSMILAPYNDAMRIGQGFNSYTHELCIDEAVLVQSENRNEADQTNTITIESPAQVVSYTARVVEKLSDVVESMNVSYCSSIRKGTVSVSGSSTTIDETTFKSADLNIVVTVKVTNQTTIIKDNAQFQKIAGIEPGSTLFNESYGDSFISGFIEGGEFTGIISLKVLDRSKVDSTLKTIKSGIDSRDKTAAGEFTLNSYGASSSSGFASAVNETESHVSVAWMGGGQIKDEHTLWDVDSVFAAAAAFPKRVSERPQRTWAILTKYKSNKSFVMQWSSQGVYKALEYDQVSSYTSELFDSYMDYKLLLKELQAIIDNQDGYEIRRGVKDALDTTMETLLSVRSAMREEQSKIIEAINVLSRDPGILKRQSRRSAIHRSDKVKAIISRALGKWAFKDPVPATQQHNDQSTLLLPTTTSIGNSDGVVELDDETSTSSTSVGDNTDYRVTLEESKAAPKLEFNFETLVPPEVWKTALPVAKPDYNPFKSAPAVASQGPQLSLNGFIPAAPSDDANWGSTTKSNTEITQGYDSMKKDLSKRTAELERVRSECDQKLADAAKTEAACNVKLLEAQAQVQEAETNYQKLNDALAAEISAKENAIRQAETSEVELKDQILTLSGNVETLNVEKGELSRDRESAREERDRARKEKESLDKDINKKNDEIRSLSVEVDTLKTEKNDLTHERDNIRNERDNFRNTLGQKENKIAELQKKGTEYETKYLTGLSELENVKGQLIPNEPDGLNIIAMIFMARQDWDNRIREKGYEYYRRDEKFQPNISFFENYSSGFIVNLSSQVATFVYRLNKSGPIKVKTMTGGDWMKFD